MTVAELVTGLEARGVTLRPTSRGTLAVRPADLLTAAEMDELRQAKPRVLALLRQRRRLSPWPESIDGLNRVLGPLGRCVLCPADPLPPRSALAQARTWCRYGSELLCLEHALQRQAAERRPS